MSSAQILVLGGIAGFTIFLGLPLGRVRSSDARLRAALSGLATGILLFLLYDVFAHGVGPVEESLEEAVAEGGSWAEFVGLAGLMAAGLILGLMSLVYYARWMKGQPRPGLVGPGAAAVAEYEARLGPGTVWRS
jgi:zinc transporter, ZIP family